MRKKLIGVVLILSGTAVVAAFAAGFYKLLAANLVLFVLVGVVYLRERSLPPPEEK